MYWSRHQEKHRQSLKSPDVRPLRFAVETRVFANVKGGGFKPGIVIGKPTKSDYDYQILIDDNNEVVYAIDVDIMIRKDINLGKSNRCAVCGETEGLKRCGRCNLVEYCW